MIIPDTRIHRLLEALQELITANNADLYHETDVAARKVATIATTIRHAVAYAKAN